MSGATATKRAQRLREALLDVAWRQWGDLGGSVVTSGKKRQRCVIDPEALILLTLWLMDDEPRLIDVAMSWLILNNEFVSVQRIRNLSGSYPAIVRERLSQLARVLAGAGADARWKPLYSTSTTALPYRDNKTRAVRVDLSQPTTLWLRLRRIFGLGVRPDVIAFLMRKADPKDYVDAGTIAAAVGYSRPAVKRVLDALVEAGGLSIVNDRDPGYSIGWTSLFTILGPAPERLPSWQYCHQTFSMLAEYIAMIDARQAAPASAFIQRADARRMIQDHGSYLVANELVSPHELPKIDDLNPLLHRIEVMLESEF